MIFVGQRGNGVKFFRTAEVTYLSKNRQESNPVPRYSDKLFSIWETFSRYVNQGGLEKRGV